MQSARLMQKVNYNEGAKISSESDSEQQGMVVELTNYCAITERVGVAPQLTIRISHAP